MPNRAKIFLLLALTAATPVLADDFSLTINGKSYDISTDEEQNLTLPDGTALTVKLQLKENQTFSTPTYSFSHDNAYRPSRQDLGSGIHQTMMVTPTGTGVLIQEYASMDPSSLVDLMVQELTKEEVQVGYAYSEKPVTKKVGGVTLKGKQAITSKQDDTWVREVYACGNGDEGLLIVTMIDEEDLDTEGPIIDEFWKTLEIKSLN